MDTEQTETLSQRLREIGFSDRAVSMIVEQVGQIDFEKTSQTGLTEHAADFASLENRIEAPVAANIQSELRILAVVGAAIAFLSILLGWSAITNTGSGELAIMAGAASAPSWLQGIQALFLAGWVALPPLISVWRGDAGSKFRQTPLLAVWGAVGLALATLLLASTG